MLSKIFILIVFSMSGMGTQNVTVIPNFFSQPQCIAAGEAIKQSGSTVTSYVCVDGVK